MSAADFIPLPPAPFRPPVVDYEEETAADIEALIAADAP